ncbi:damage-inducible protein DinB [Alteribacter lacisalsi]|uniref:Damage-inducible protein DinB n=1 Tax=Alteribacter lacisalsi TaxID=2045244 RepID=A0A2W0HNQ8_9BACI|nr:DinB family protein [Alteribacter lacisalsi]PYZ99235.1 damage-inducible protein DinB [Alteribacter lacisalsi]
MKTRDSLYISPMAGYEPEIGRWLWSMSDVRRSLKEKLSDVPDELLDQREGKGHSIGTLLYHIAIVEAGWFYGEVKQTDFDPDIKRLFPEDGWSDGKLTHVGGERLEAHFHRLNQVRNVFFDHFRTMTVEDWRRPRTLEDYDVTPEWVVYHLIEHEAHHRGQIFSLLKELRK